MPHIQSSTNGRSETTEYYTGVLLSKTNNEHQAVPDRDHHQKSQETTGYASGDEMLDSEVSLSSLRVFHHDGR